ncbi:MAG: DUF3179 domain-containing protein, partial [Chloroflexi bacterium]|nr:DUF3179 domain-containing protein [Chloroflexota bacterium]
MLVLVTVAAQCGSAPSPANTAEKGDEVAQPVAGEANEVAQPVAGEAKAAEESASEAKATEESPTENKPELVGSADQAAQPTSASNAQAESETAVQTSDQSTDCTDPFAGSSLRFTPDVWTAESLARYVGAEIVEPTNGLKTNFCQHNADYNDIISGGPPPDGIPSIDNPTFDPIATGDEWLVDVQPVIALAVGDEAKAYPLAILTLHEIANDEIAGMPVAVTFCPLCNAAVVFKREV